MFIRMQRKCNTKNRLYRGQQTCVNDNGRILAHPQWERHVTNNARCWQWGTLGVGSEECTGTLCSLAPSLCNPKTAQKNVYQLRKTKWGDLVDSTVLCPRVLESRCRGSNPDPASSKLCNFWASCLITRCLSFPIKNIGTIPESTL